MCPSPNSFAWYRRCCRVFSKGVLGEIQWHTIEIILRHFKILSQPEFSWNLIKFFSKTFFELTRSPNSFVWYQKCWKAFPKCVLGEIQWHSFESFLRHFKILSQPEFSWNLIKNLSKTFSNCVLAQIHLHGIEDVVRYFQNVS